jgi:hypothetical protein
MSKFAHAGQPDGAEDFPGISVNATGTVYHVDPSQNGRAAIRVGGKLVQITVSDADMPPPLIPATYSLDENDEDDKDAAEYDPKETLFVD